jgi:hypothetical protein
MTKAALKKLIARVILAGHEAGIKMESPYDIENMVEDHFSHSNMMDLFYDKKGEPIKVIENAQRIVSS